ncbi:MAG: ATP-binding protein [Firmicutes bacterium]|nr:DUF2791 family P-loop domain-containing protein [Alicyclobacillaceae bacterium]MCL6497552.1 ATP-binding protein [Bacillota bacterium]
MSADRESWLRFARLPAAEMLIPDSVRETFVDPGTLWQFWCRHYLETFVPQGYGKVKWILGGPGAGKTHFLRHLKDSAQAMGYLTAWVDARQARLSGIEELYRRVAAAVDWEALIEGVGHRLLRDTMGERDYEGPLASYLTWAAAQGRSPEVTEDLVRETGPWLKRWDLERNIARVLRHALHARWRGETPDPRTVAWLRGEPLTAADRRQLGVLANVSRRNARAVLASLALLAHVAGRRGLVVAVDNLDVLGRPERLEGVPYYSRSLRDQAYEMLRELIDHSIHTPYTFFALAATTNAVTDPFQGFPAYPALWARLESEVRTDRLNRWSDLIDLDHAWETDPDRRAALAHQWAVATVIWDPQSPRFPRDTDQGWDWGWPRRAVAQVARRRAEEAMSDD